MPIFYIVALLLALVSTGAVRAQSPVSTANSPHYVFAHYMVCYANYGDNLDAYKKDILAAQRRGIDGFALNCGGWKTHESQYRARAVNFYEAARELGTGFKLFISADFNGQLPNDDIADMIVTFRDHPNQLQFNGKPVLSTFGGEGTDNTQGKAIVAFVHQQGAVIVPSFYPRPNITETPDQARVDQVFDTYPDLDGYFYFGAAGYTTSLPESNALLAKKWIGAGKIYMASVTPFYRGKGGNYRVFETNGFEAMQKEWMAAIEGRATWIEITTWNDYNESTYVSPYDTPEVAASGLDLGNREPHVTYLDCSRYYINWFKSGVQPLIAHDSLYYFYRVHPKALPAEVGDDPSKLGVPDGAQYLTDNVYVTLTLKTPADLTITSGPASRVFHLPAGVSDVDMPFAPGNQRFVLTRNSVTLIDKTGEQPVQSVDTSSRFNYFAGEATAL